MERQPSDAAERLRPDLLTLEPYSTPVCDAPVRLASNESPVAPSAALTRELAAEVERLALHRYPDRDARGLNVDAERVDGVLAVLPSMQSPTVSRHADDHGHAVETVVEKTCVNTLIPRLKALGASDILELPISKIIP
jgi:ATP phosphoribosyltransferase-like protein